MVYEPVTFQEKEDYWAMRRMYESMQKKGIEMVRQAEAERRLQFDMMQDMRDRRAAKMDLMLDRNAKFRI